jgi:carboxymethylenebutenolidase
MTGMMQFGGVSGYLARPDTDGPWPAVIVIQEWWGLDAQTKSIADRVAGLGYLAFAPDLYHGEIAQLGDREKASILAGKYAGDAPDELVSVFNTLRDRSDCNGHVGCMGFCWGGRMSLALALRSPVKVVCTFYGGGMQNLFDELKGLHAPVLGLYGDQDQSIPPGTIEEFDRLLDRQGVEHEIVVYPNSGHAFFRDLDPTVYRPEAARDAWERTQKFLAAHLN